MRRWVNRVTSGKWDFVRVVPAHWWGGAEEVQADCICIVYPGVCYRGRRRCKLTVFV